MKFGEHIIPDTSDSGSSWKHITFEEFAALFKQDGDPYKLNVAQIIYELYKETIKKIGFLKGTKVFLKSVLWDSIFNQPIWEPDRFNIDTKERHDFYYAKFKEYMLFIIYFRNLGMIIGPKEADHFMADQMLPITLLMMKSRFSPKKDILTVEEWLKQARNYLGDEIEKNKGFQGEIFIAEDKSEMRFHITRCATTRIVSAYGLTYTAALLCMGDHITYHTVFPNLIFKRSHSLTVGDDYCDHTFRLRTDKDPVMDEENYGDCYRIPGLRETVREWEEEAKVLFFGSKEKWNDYARRYFTD